MHRPVAQGATIRRTRSNALLYDGERCCNGHVEERFEFRFLQRPGVADAKLFEKVVFHTVDSVTAEEDAGGRPGPGFQDGA